MKLKTIISLLLPIAVLFVGCKNGSNTKDFSFLDKPSSDSEWYVGCWSADDGSHLYVSKVEKEDEYGGDVGHLFLKRHGDIAGSYDECYFEGDVENMYIRTGDEYGYEKDCLLANKTSRSIKDMSSDLVFHRDASIEDSLGEEIVVSLIQKKAFEQEAERKDKEVKKKMQKDNSWIYGEWTSDDESMTIKKPNLVKPSWIDFGEWFPFTITDNIMTIDYGQDGDIIYMDADSETLSKGSTMDDKIYGVFTKGKHRATTTSSSSTSITTSNAAVEMPSSSSRQVDYSWVKGIWYCTTPIGTFSIQFQGDGQSGRVVYLPEALNAYSAEYGTYRVEDSVIRYHINGEPSDLFYIIEIHDNHRLYAGEGYYYKKIR